VKSNSLYFYIVLVFCLCPITIFSDTLPEPDLVINVNFIPDPYGLTYDWNTERLWVGTAEYMTKEIYRITIEENPSIEEQFTISGGPNLILGIAYTYDTNDSTNKLYFTGNDRNIYWVNLDTGEPYISQYYKQTPLYWYGSQPLALNNMNPAIYCGDWNVDEIAYASPPDTGSWITTGATNISGMGCSFSNYEEPTCVWAVSQNFNNAQAFQYILNGGEFSGTMYVYDFPEGYLTYDTGDCAYDGRYLYVMDQNSSKIYRFDVINISIQSASIGSIKALFTE